MRWTFQEIPASLEAGIFLAGIMIVALGHAALFLGILRRFDHWLKLI
jgi:mannose/fructose/N-acetylgalactosamine-specific phosphotransferase system component IIC